MHQRYSSKILRETIYLNLPKVDINLEPLNTYHSERKYTAMKPGIDGLEIKHKCHH
jgi:hypothetical protein